MKFIDRYITTCPYCHNRLEDIEENEVEKKACKSDICKLTCGDKGRQWESVELD